MTAEQLPSRRSIAESSAAIICAAWQSMTTNTSENVRRSQTQLLRRRCIATLTTNPADCPPSQTTFVVDAASMGDPHRNSGGRNVPNVCNPCSDCGCRQTSPQTHVTREMARKTFTCAESELRLPPIPRKKTSGLPTASCTTAHILLRRASSPRFVPINSGKRERNI